MKIKKISYTKEIEKEIRAGLKEHALSQIGNLDQTEDYEAMAIYSEAALAGVIVFRKFWGSIDVKYLYVNKDFRSNGIGRKLLENVIDIAKNEYNSKAIYLDTMSYQALGFYLKLGFKLEFTRKSFINNIERHYLSLILEK